MQSLGTVERAALFSSAIPHLDCLINTSSYDSFALDCNRRTEVRMNILEYACAPCRLQVPHPHTLVITD